MVLRGFPSPHLFAKYSLSDNVFKRYVKRRLKSPGPNTLMFWNSTHF